MMHNRRKSTCLALEMFYMPLYDDCGGDEFWSCVGSIFRGFRRSVAQALISFQHTQPYTCLQWNMYFHIRRWNKGYSPRYSIIHYITTPPLWNCRRSYTYGCVYHEMGESDFPNQWSPIVFCICECAHIHTGSFKEFPYSL